jgi:SET domain-containing protein
MLFYEIKDTENKGKGLFATQLIKKGEFLFHLDLTQLPRYTLNEISQNPELSKIAEHADYVGNGKYVIDLSPPSYINHSCVPNCVVKMKSIAIKDVIAFRDIIKGEELSVDYTLTAVDQFDGKGFWVLDCKCGSENCRRKVVGDFFTLPIEYQKKFYRNLPNPIIKKYKKYFEKL